jgi:hypothetical protein
MTLARKLALSLSSRVVRWASPGCKEWAEGLAREVAFIPSDWRALAWALGGTRVLLDRREAPIATLDEAFAEAQRFFDKRRLAPLAIVCMTLFLSFTCLCLLFSASSLGPRPRAWQIGLSILLAATLYWGHRSFTRSTRELDRPLGRYEAVVSYRDQLQRNHKAQHSWTSRLANLASYSVFIVIYARFGRREFEEFFVSYSGGLMLLMYIHCAIQARLNDRKNVRRIANLDALLASGPEASAL